MLRFPYRLLLFLCPYLSGGTGGKETLGELFEDRSQLIVYHFMFAPDWKEGCG